MGHLPLRSRSPLRGGLRERLRLRLDRLRAYPLPEALPRPPDGLSLSRSSRSQLRSRRL